MKKSDSLLARSSAFEWRRMSRGGGSPVGRWCQGLDAHTAECVCVGDDEGKNGEGKKVE